ncbi:hypothetical protein PIB30_043957 [Stylosanthes scabra]|uniref:Uncharacterized protein n=1 Tax=Stylosanthes scabra TaxID=79078 RepID=A0ABU6YE31_9FABA|nr:hypothetical protein [Stylosanthes scabra]
MGMIPTSPWYYLYDSVHLSRSERIMEEIIADQIYKTDLSSSLPFAGIIAALCLEAKVVTHKDNILIPQELPIVGEAMVRVREPRAKTPKAKQTRQEAPQQQQQPPQEQSQPQVQ